MKCYLLESVDSKEIIILHDNKIVTTGFLSEFNGWNGWQCSNIHEDYIINCFHGKLIDEQTAKTLMKCSPKAFFRKIIQQHERKSMNRYLIYPTGMYPSAPLLNLSYSVYAHNPKDAMRKFIRHCGIAIEYAEVRNPKTRRIVAKYFRPQHMRCGEVVVYGE